MGRTWNGKDFSPFYGGVIHAAREFFFGSLLRDAVAREIDRENAELSDTEGQLTDGLMEPPTSAPPPDPIAFELPPHASTTTGDDPPEFVDGSKATFRMKQKSKAKRKRRRDEEDAETFVPTVTCPNSIAKHRTGAEKITTDLDTEALLAANGGFVARNIPRPRTPPGETTLEDALGPKHALTLVKWQGM